MEILELPKYSPFHADVQAPGTVGEGPAATLRSRCDSLEDLCLLVVDENSFERNILSHLLQHSTLFSSQVHHAQDMASATEIMKRHRPDAVVLDSILPNGHVRQDAVTCMRGLQRIQADVAFVILAREEDQAQAVYALQEGASDYLLKEQVQRNPLNFYRSIKTAVQRKLLEREFQRTVQILRERNRELELLNQQLWKLSHTDELTGYFNRRHIMSRLEEEVSRGLRYGSPLSVVLVDIDHFKRVNDTFGHLAGDRALQAIADVFRSKLRESDLIGRFGGEEFLLILPHTELGGAEVFCHRLRDQVENHPVPLGERTIHLTSSFGLAGLTPAMDTAQKLLRLADRNLYQAKTLGRNRVIAEQAGADFWSPDSTSPWPPLSLANAENEPDALCASAQDRP